MKNAIMKITKSVLFISILIFSILLSSFMLAPKDNTKNSGINNPVANGFLSEPKNTIDIAIIGNSDAYSGFSPMELWNEYGYTSYVSAEGRQNVVGATAMLKKIIKVQSPRLVILETDGFFTKSNLTTTISNLFFMHFGTSFSVFQYHDRWKRVEPSEMFRKPKYTAHSATKGQMLSNDIVPYTGGEYMTKSDEIAEIPSSTTLALDKFLEICQKNDIEVLFVEAPSQHSWSYKKYNAVKKLADEKGITFIDLNIDTESFKFDWKTDTRDRGNHLNNSGARKLTRHIGKFISENFSLTDHRGDKNYEHWDKDYEQYKRDVKI